MQFSRRDAIRTGAAGLVGAAVVGTATAESHWTYDPVGAAAVPGATDAVLQDGWAFVANFRGMATYDLSDPGSPTPGGYVQGNDHSHDNRDVKVDGDVAAIADNATTGTPQHVTFFDVGDPSSPEQVAHYEADTGIHNHFIYGDYAYLEQSAGLEVVDIGEIRAGDDDPALEAVARFELREFRPDLAEETSDNLHDIYVQDDYCYLAYWDAGVIVLDVTDPTEPRAVAHFSAYTGDEEEAPQNAHYVQPTPDREYTIVGAETFGTPPHGATHIFHTPALADHDPDKLDSIEPLAGEVDGEGEGRNPRTKTARADPYNPTSVDFVRPDEPQDAVSTAHNSDLTNDKMFTAWYQSGIRAYDFSNIREEGEPDEGEFVEIAAWDPPTGDFFWSAENLESAAADRDDLYYTVGSDTGKGLHVLELRSEDDGGLI